MAARLVEQDAALEQDHVGAREGERILGHVLAVERGEIGEEEEDRILGRVETVEGDDAVEQDEERSLGERETGEGEHGPPEAEDAAREPAGEAGRLACTQAFHLRKIASKMRRPGSGAERLARLPPGSST